MRYFLLITFFISIASVKAQSFWEIDSLFCEHSTWWEMERDVGIPVDTNKCKLAVQKAKEDATQNFFVFNVHGCITLETDASMYNTFLVLLESKYGINTYLNSDYNPVFYNECYECYSNIALNKKYNYNFYDMVHREADSLDKVGMGFKQPEYKNGNLYIKCELNCDIKTKGLSDSLLNEREYIVLLIDTNGRIKNYHFLDHKKHSQEFIELLNKSMARLSTFSPAYLQGRKIETQWFLYFSPGWVKSRPCEIYNELRRKKK